MGQEDTRDPGLDHHQPPSTPPVPSTPFLMIFFGKIIDAEMKGTKINSKW